MPCFEPTNRLTKDDGDWQGLKVLQRPSRFPFFGEATRQECLGSVGFCRIRVRSGFAAWTFVVVDPKRRIQTVGSGAPLAIPTGSYGIAARAIGALIGTAGLRRWWITRSPRLCAAGHNGTG